MSKIKSYTNLLKHFTLLSLILFSLAPCAVKEFVGVQIDFNFNKSLNKSKTIVQQIGCQASLESFSNQFNSLKNNFVRKDKFRSKTAILFKHLTRKSVNDYPEVFSSNSPPKYILYKRLKIAAT